MIDYSALNVVGLKEVLQTIASACNKLDVDFFLVGAVARNIWFAKGDKDAGGTRDIDFGIYVTDQETYNQLKMNLINEFKYIQASDNVFGLDTPDGKRIDLLPFGEIAHDGELIMEGRGMTKIRLDGFEEAYLHGSILAEIEKDSYRACSIPGIVILKLIAYDDRPDRRIKDIKDINRICEHYPDIETNMIWEEHSDLYNDKLDHSEVSMIVLGRLMQRIMKENQALSKRVVSIIDKALKYESDILEQMINDSMTQTLDEKAAIFQNIKRGIEE